MSQASRRDVLVGAAALATAASSATEALAATASAAPVSMTAAPPEAWDLSELYPNAAAWTAERTSVQAAVADFAKYKGKLGTNAATLRAALQAYSDMRRRSGRLDVYASLLADADKSVGANQERRQQSIALSSELDEATAFIQPEILAVGATKIGQFQSVDTGLAKFKFMLADILRLAPHTLGAEAESVLAAAGAPLAGIEQIRDQLVASDIPWPQVTLSTGEKLTLDDATYTSAREAPNRDDRKLVMSSFFGEYDRFKTSLGASLATQVQGNIFNAKARKYGSALEAALSGAGNVPTGVYRTLVAETNTGLPVLHRYFDVRRRLLKLPDMHYYDIYPPAVTLEKKFSLADYRSLTLAGVAPLGPDYVNLLAASTAKPWADYLPRKNKASGAYMNPGAYDVHPYLLLNQTGNYDSVSTFAHEWGHAMHSLLANSAQPFETADYPIFLAEIASTCNELLLAAYMQGNASTPAEKLFYLDAQLELMRGTFFRQTMFGEFELMIHERVEKGDALSGDSLNTMYLALLKKYHGNAVIVDDFVAAEWAYIPHFYYNFYVYQYASSIAASAYFVTQIQAGGTAARDNYLGVLKSGGSDYPVDILKKAGLDMTTPAPYRALVDKMSKTLDQIEALI